MNDVRYSELKFLTALQTGKLPYFNNTDPQQTAAFSPAPGHYPEMVLTLLEERYVDFRAQPAQLLLSKLRGDLSADHLSPSSVGNHEWQNPREALRNRLSGQILQELVITYRGLRRIEELRDLLRRDRILEHFGILLDLRYFAGDLRDALARDATTPISVIYADMDNFKPINDNFGHEAGDAVMAAYLATVRDSVGVFGTAYRGRGDETESLIVGQGHARAAEIAETIRQRVAEFRVEHDGTQLPPVTASIGVASTPPEARRADIESLAESRNRQAKQSGKNKVIKD